LRVHAGRHPAPPPLPARPPARAQEKRELIFKEDGQEYAQVLRMLGNGRLEAQCIDGTKRLCHIRGKMRKKVRAMTDRPPCATTGAAASPGAASRLLPPCPTRGACERLP
jgi:hypothetical protein